MMLEQLALREPQIHLNHAIMNQQLARETPHRSLLTAELLDGRKLAQKAGTAGSSPKKPESRTSQQLRGVSLAAASVLKSRDLVPDAATQHSILQQAQDLHLALQGRRGTEIQMKKNLKPSSKRPGLGIATELQAKINLNRKYQRNANKRFSSMGSGPRVGGSTKHNAKVAQQLYQTSVGRELRSNKNSRSLVSRPGSLNLGHQSLAAGSDKLKSFQRIDKEVINQAALALVEATQKSS